MLSKDDDKYYQPILEAISEKGALGVTQIASIIARPPSSVQKYLEKQHHFRKNIDRKWDLAERVSFDVSAQLEENKLISLAKGIQVQATLVTANLDLFSSTYMTLVHQLEGISPLLTTYKAVIEKAQVDLATDKAIERVMDPVFTRLKEEAKTLKQLITKYRDKFGTDNATLLSGVNWIELRVALGTVPFLERVSTPLANFITDDIPFSEDALALFKQYQKNKR